MLANSDTQDDGLTTRLLRFLSVAETGLFASMLNRFYSFAHSLTPLIDRINMPVICLQLTGIYALC